MVRNERGTEACNVPEAELWSLGWRWIRRGNGGMFVDGFTNGGGKETERRKTSRLSRGAPQLSHTDRRSAAGWTGEREYDV